MPEARGHHMQYKAKDAYSSDDKKLGHILETDDNAFLVRQGMLFTTLFYLPTRLLVSSDVDRAFLTVTEDEAKALAREDLPATGDAWYGLNDDRVELTVPLTNAEPTDEPIYGHTEAIPLEQMEAAGLPDPERAAVGLGDAQPVVTPAIA